MKVSPTILAYKQGKDVSILKKTMLVRFQPSPLDIVPNRRSLQTNGDSKVASFSGSFANPG